MSPLKRRPKQEGRHTPNLGPVWLVALVSLLLVGLLAFGLYKGAHALLTAENTGEKPVSVQDVIKTTVTVLTLIGAVLAALYAYRKQLLEEGASHRADATQLADRYAKAAEQLGHDQAAVRLAGAYAMARLADDWPEQRQVCVNVLCAYLRMPYETDPTEPVFKHGEREVRITIIRTIRDHLQDPTTGTTWCGLDLDFTGAVFDDGDWRNSTFSGGTVNFSNSTFSGGTVDFSNSTFSGGTVRFCGSTYSSGMVLFGGSKFSDGIVDFSNSAFSGGTVYFGDSTFSGGEVDFSDSTYSGGTVYFLRSTYSGGRVFFGRSTYSGGRVNFSSSRFSGGGVSFNGSTYSSGEVSFNGSTFSGGEVYLSHSTYSGSEIDFRYLTFSGGEVGFPFSTFSGSTVDFRRSTFLSGEVDFGRSTFSDGVIDFSDSSFSGSSVQFADVRVHAPAAINWGPFPTIPVNQP
ncbi:pentapeptide repeat-containing protein [Streptomyces sp. NPDC058293]|uniref:pentapeptide repeat-containing protein n=1 Tax=Streptomyces sp. NPDC058293 TaxID=3346429 RepID=UPI0036EA1813